jgi:hypothetical protein
MVTVTVTVDAHSNTKLREVFLLKSGKAMTREHGKDGYVGV